MTDTLGGPGRTPRPSLPPSIRLAGALLVMVPLVLLTAGLLSRFLTGGLVRDGVATAAMALACATMYTLLFRLPPQTSDTPGRVRTLWAALALVGFLGTWAALRWL